MGSLTAVLYTIFGITLGAFGPSIYIFLCSIFIFLQSIDIFYLSYFDIRALILFTYLYFFIYAFRNQSLKNIFLTFLLPAVLSFCSTFYFISIPGGISEEVSNMSTQELLDNNASSSLEPKLFKQIISDFTSQPKETRALLTSSSLTAVFVFLVFIFLRAFNILSFKNTNSNNNRLFSLLMGAGIASVYVQVTTEVLSYKEYLLILVQYLAIIVGIISGFIMIKRTPIGKYLYSDKLYEKATTYAFYVVLGIFAIITLIGIFTDNIADSTFK